MVTLSKAKKRFHGEWIAFFIKQNGKDKDPLGEILEHDVDKRELHRKLRENEIKDAYITFAGPPVKPGYEVML